jgi:hypothetical protein
MRTNKKILTVLSYVKLCGVFFFFFSIFLSEKGTYYYGVTVLLVLKWRHGTTSNVPLIPPIYMYPMCFPI